MKTFLAAGFLALSYCLATADTLPAGSQIIYDDTLENGWVDYGWATLNYSNASPVHGTGGTSIRVDAGANQALYIHHASFDSTTYASLTFWIHGGTVGGQSLKLQAHVNGNALTAVPVPAPQANTWQQVTVSLASLGAAAQGSFDGFWIQNTTNATLPTFYVDDIALVGAPPPASVDLRVDAGSVIRTLDARLFGVNTAIYDNQLGKDVTQPLLAGIGAKALRYPGGSCSDDYDWQVNRNVVKNDFIWVSGFSVFTKLAENLGAQPYITVNYGSGTPEEAAAWVAYANASADNPLALGTDSKGRDWKTAGYWAALRGAVPLATDDGQNFLRVSHPAPYKFRYWEVGNENYGDWEHDEHGSTFPGSPHDPYTYAQNFAVFRQKMLAVDPTARIGAVVINGQDRYGNGQHGVVNPADGKTYTGWTPVVLANLKTLGALPHFLAFHDYPQNPGSEGDSALLSVASTFTAADAVDLRTMLTNYVGGGAAAGIELALTEVNSVTGSPGKQTTNLVDALFYAETMTSLATTEFNACTWWDLRDGNVAGNNMSSALYGWRLWGDYGFVATDQRSDTPVNTPYPAYHAAELFSKWAAPGDAVVAASSSYSPLTVHAARRANGDLCLLVVNRSADNDLTGKFTISHFNAGSDTATMYRYGKADDLNKTGFTTETLSGVSSGNFSATFPAYSLTVLRLAGSATPFATWQSAHFTPAQLAESSVSSDLADPDGDGVVNLLEYALGLDPLVPGGAGLPTSSTTTLSGARYATLTYTRVKAATDLAYLVEVSGDLANWNNGSAYTAETGVLDQGTIQQVTTRDLVALTATTPHRFMRLRVTR